MEEQHKDEVEKFMKDNKPLTLMQKFMIVVIFISCILAFTVLGYKLGLRHCNDNWISACGQALNLCRF